MANRRRTDTEGKYKKRVEEDETYKDIAGVRPGIGTAITVSDIEDELSKEDYNFDIYAKKNIEHFFEVEVKTQWRDKWNSSWKEIRIPERKQRLSAGLLQKYKLCQC